MFSSCLIACCCMLYSRLLDVVTLDSGSMSGTMIGSCLLGTSVTGSPGGMVSECLDDCRTIGKCLVDGSTTCRGSSDGGAADDGLGDCDTSGNGLYDVVAVASGVDDGVMVGKGSDGVATVGLCLTMIPRLTWAWVVETRLAMV